VHRKALRYGNRGIPFIRLDEMADGEPEEFRKEACSPQPTYEATIFEYMNSKDYKKKESLN
jgi:hypothetical protein